MELAKLAGQHIFQLSDNNGTVIKTGCMTLAADGTGTFVLANYASDRRPCTISTGIDLPGLTKDNVGQITMNFHQDQGHIATNWYFSVSGNQWLFQSADGDGTGVGYRVQ
jgi:hypothetical protein